jgi:hypothetical protein
MTWHDLIRSSLRLIGQLGPGRGPNQSEITDSLFVLNAMLEGFSIERLAIPTLTRKVYAPPAGAASYRIGCGGELSLQTRPTRVESAARIVPGVTACECPVDVLSHDEWACGTCGVYYDGGWPCGTVWLNPPLQSGEQLVLYVWAPLGAAVEDAGETVDFPPGYSDMLRYQLAVRLCPEWGKVPRPDVMQLAADSLARIKSFNSSPPPIMESPFGGGVYDICSDRYR